MGESFGEPATELGDVDAADSDVTWRRNAACCGRAVVLILTGGQDGRLQWVLCALSQRSRCCFSG